MDIARQAIEKKTITLVLTFVMIGAGFISYNNLSRLEDPAFTIKDALVITPYPGASAAEVEEEVSDELEQAAQKLGQLKRVISRSERGLSTLTVTIEDKYDKTTLPQVWDELRRKVGDAASNLPPGAGPSIVVDDFGDVYGVFVAVSSDEYSYAELKEFVDFLKREFLLVQDVAKVETFGERQEVVYVELQRDRMAQLGIATSIVINELQNKNLVSNTGRAEVGGEFITIDPTGTITSVEEFGSILISKEGRGGQIYLRDIATVRRGYAEPANQLIRYDGKNAIGVGISTVAGGNVVVMGEALSQRAQELMSEFPLGIDFGIVSLQSQSVTKAISNFVISLLEAVAIVIVVLLFFMGVRSGLLIGFILVLTIFGTFIFLGPMQVALERISLGALIIALGMLVDNAIVIVDGMLIKMQRGVEPKKAASEIVKQSAIPLLGATIIAILGFAAIGTSQDKTGEFCRSLYQVILTSLLLSWVTAVTVTPLLGVMFLKAPKSSDGGDPYGGGFYTKYKRLLRGCIRRRWMTMMFVFVVFATAVWGFGFVERSFFPPSTRPQFMVDLWMPQGTHIDETTRTVEEIEQYMTGLDGVTHVASVIGKGALRFILTYAPEKANPSYAQFFVDVDDWKKIHGLSSQIERDLAERYPGALSYTNKFILGPGEPGKIQARFSGPDPDVLRALSSQVQEIMHADPNAKGIRTDWRQRVKVIVPEIIEETANVNGIERRDVANVIAQGFQGVTVGVYREADLLLPIVLRAAESQRLDIASIQNLQIWSPAAGKMIPLRQVVSGFATKFEDEIIQRRNRKRTIITYCDPVTGTAPRLLEQLQPKIEAIERPEGYTLEWGGEFENSGDAQAALAGGIPKFVLLMILITIALFNSLRTPLVIWGIVPLAVIGVTAGLLVTNNPFGFMSLLGFLSLMGMLIKNAVVLIDQINLEISEGKPVFEAIVDSGASRLRPVGMAAATTALGMIPLLIDPFFSAMAITIIGGLAFATVLTMVLVPVLFAILYRVRAESSAPRPAPEPESAQT